MMEKEHEEIHKSGEVKIGAQQKLAKPPSSSPFREIPTDLAFFRGNRA